MKQTNCWMIWAMFILSTYSLHLFGQTNLRRTLATCATTCADIATDGCANLVASNFSAASGDSERTGTCNQIDIADGGTGISCFEFEANNDEMGIYFFNNYVETDPGDCTTASITLFDGTCADITSQHIIRQPLGSSVGFIGNLIVGDTYQLCYETITNGCNITEICYQPFGLCLGSSGSTVSAPTCPNNTLSITLGDIQTNTHQSRFFLVYDFDVSNPAPTQQELYDHLTGDALLSDLGYFEQSSDDSGSGFSNLAVPNNTCAILAVELYLIPGSLSGNNINVIDACSIEGPISVNIPPSQPTLTVATAGSCGQPAMVQIGFDRGDGAGGGPDGDLADPEDHICITEMGTTPTDQPCGDGTNNRAFSYDYTPTDLANELGGDATCYEQIMGSVAASCPQAACICMPPTITATSPDCAGGSGTGTLIINASSNTGNTLEYSIDGTTFQSSNMFNNLDNGGYTVTVRDVNEDCSATAMVFINCIFCPNALSINETDEVCVTGQPELTAWQTTVTTANANIEGMTGPFYSDVPHTAFGFPQPIDNADYDGNQCNRETSTYYAYYTCDDNGSTIPAGSYTLNIYPAISQQNNVVLEDGSCCPSLSLQCSQSIYQVNNSLDNRGATPFCSNIHTQGTITFTISLRNPPTGLAEACLNQTLTATYDCRICPTARTAKGTFYFCGTDSDLDLTIGGETGVNIVNDPSHTFAGVEWYPQGVTPGTTPPYIGGTTSVANNCESVTTQLTAYLQCDLNGDGFTGDADDSYIPAGNITVAVYPDIASQNNIVINDGGCCPSLQLACPNHYQYTNTLQQTPNTPNCTGLQGEGSFHFVVQLPNAPTELMANCRAINIPVTYRCCLAAAGQLTSVSPCPGDDFLLHLSEQTVDADYGTWLLITDAEGQMVEIIDFAGASSVAIPYAKWANYLGYGLDYFCYSYNYQLAQPPLPTPQISLNLTDIGTTNTQSACFALSAAQSIYIPQAFGSAGLSASEGNQGGVTPFFYNEYVITFMGGTPPYTLTWEQEGFVRKKVAFYEDGYDHELDDLDMPIVGLNAPNSNPGGIMTIIYSDQANWQVSITDANGCTSAALQKTNDNTDNGSHDQILDIYDQQITGASSTQHTDGAIDIMVAGGCPPYAYLWGGPNGFTATTEDVTNLHYGWYQVSVTDAGGNPNCPDAQQQSTIGWYWVMPNMPNSGGGLIRGKYSVISTTPLSVYPNPLATSNNIVFTTAETTEVVINVYNIAGKKMDVLFKGTTVAQQLQTVSMETHQWPNGIYLLELLTATGERQQQKIVISH